jgi:hypothetical protein
MVHKKTRLSMLGAGGLMASVLVFTPPSPAESVAPATPCPTVDDHRIGLHEIDGPLNVFACDLEGTTLVGTFGQAKIPAPGNGVTASVDGTFGGAQLEVSVDEDGNLSASETGPAGNVPSSVDDPAPTGSPRPCRNDNYQTINGTEGAAMKDHEWYYRVNRGSIPSGLRVGRVVSVIYYGSSHMFNGVNQCDLPQRVPDTPNELIDNGNTTRRANIASSTGSCVDRDEHNVVEFGNLPSASYARTCVWWSEESGIDKIREADTRFNKADHRFVAVAGPSCSGKKEIRSLMTHEYGHAMGLGDLDGSENRGLTMYGHGSLCDSSKWSLAKGDMCGLYWLYQISDIDLC